MIEDSSIDGRRAKQMDDIARLRNLASDRYSSEGGEIGYHRAFVAKQPIDCSGNISLGRDCAFGLIDREYGMGEIDQPPAFHGGVEAGMLRLRRGMLMAAEVLCRSIEIGVKHLTERAS